MFFHQRILAIVTMLSAAFAQASSGKRGGRGGHRGGGGGGGGGNNEVIRVVTRASGAQEVPPVASSTKSSLKLQFDPAFSYVRFAVDVMWGVGITIAHIHCAVAGENGPVAATLFPVTMPGVNVNGELASGVLTNAEITGTECVPPITSVVTLYDAIRNGRAYLNVHSEANPSGENRGQIFLDV